MNIQKVETIIRQVDGDESADGLSTLGMALIHVACHTGYSKEDMLRAMSGQWDIYVKFGRDRLH